MFILNALVQPPVAANSTQPVPRITHSRPFSQDGVTGTISVITQRNRPTELLLNFNDGEGEGSQREIRINLTTGIGTFTRPGYQPAQGQYVRPVTVTFRSDAAAAADGERRFPLGLLGSVLGQSEIAVNRAYGVIGGLPVIQAYSRSSGSLYSRAPGTTREDRQNTAAFRTQIMNIVRGR